MWEWYGVTVEGGRVTKLWWKPCHGSYDDGDDNDFLLSGVILAEIGALSALARPDLNERELSSTVPITFANLQSLKSLRLYTPVVPTDGLSDYVETLVDLARLYLEDCSLSGGLSTLAKIKNLTGLGFIEGNTLSNGPTHWLDDKPSIQVYFLSLWRP